MATKIIDGRTGIGLAQTTDEVIRDYQEAAARDALAKEFDKDYVPNNLTRTELEMRRGRAVLVERELQRRALPPDAAQEERYGGAHRSAESRAYQDNYVGNRAEARRILRDAFEPKGDKKDG